MARTGRGFMMNMFTTAGIADAISRKKPATRKSFIEIIKDSLDGVDLKIVDTHNTASIIFTIQNNYGSVLLKAELGRDTATHREIRWYEHQAAIGKDHHRLFTSGTRTDSYALLFLRYIDGASTLDEWVGKTGVNGSDFATLVWKTLAYDRSLFAETSRKIRQSDIERFISDKYRTRREESKKTGYLDDLLSARYVTINGELYLTPDSVMREVAKNPVTMKRLLPTEVGVVHGDLHTGNVLIKGNELYYVDPNGSLSMPIEYDIGKLLHSVHGRYPLIMQGKFLVKEITRSIYEYTVRENAAYTAAHEYLRSRLTHDEYLRSLYLEALHFATMLPHHAKNKMETIALYLRATELFNELLIML